MKKIIISIISFVKSVVKAIISFFSKKNTNQVEEVVSVEKEKRHHIVLTSNGKGTPQGATRKIKDTSNFKHEVSMETREKMSANLKGKKTQGFRKVVQVEIENFEVVGIFKSIAEASKMTGVSDVSICNCCRDKVYTAGGFLWAYVEDWDKSMVVA